MTMIHTRLRVIALRTLLRIVLLWSATTIYIGLPARCQAKPDKEGNAILANPGTSDSLKLASLARQLGDRTIYRALKKYADMAAEQSIARSDYQLRAIQLSVHSADPAACLPILLKYTKKRSPDLAPAAAFAVRDIARRIANPSDDRSSGEMLPASHEDSVTMIRSAIRRFDLSNIPAVRRGSIVHPRRLIVQVLQEAVALLAR